MFYHVRGKLIHGRKGMAAVEVRRGGFMRRKPPTTPFEAAGIAVPEVTRRHLFPGPREGAMELYGFYDQGELNCFQMLLTVSGVGPKAALAILSHLSPEKICPLRGDRGCQIHYPPRGRAETGPEADSGALDKVQKEQIAEGVGMDGVPAPAVLAGANVQRPSALWWCWGYTQSGSVLQMAKLDPSLPVEELIRLGLKEKPVATGK